MARYLIFLSYTHLDTGYAPASAAGYFVQDSELIDVQVVPSDLQ